MNFASIDLGTFHTKMAMLDALGNPKVITNDAGEGFLRSVVFFEEGSILVGSEAENAALMEPEKAVFDWKRSMGTDTVLMIYGGKKYRAKDIAVLILKECCTIYEKRTGQVLSHVAISVPANYPDRSKAETIEAAEECSLKVVGLYHEPTCAAHGNKVFERGDGLTAVFDLGGGTFDFSLCKTSGNSMEIISTNGVPKLGGIDYHKRIFEKILSEYESKHGKRPDSKTNPIEFQELHHRVEQAKIGLSSRPNVKIPFICGGKAVNVSFTQADFQALCGDINQLAIECAEKTLKEANIASTSLKELMAVGGGSLVYGFKEAIELKFGKRPTQFCEPHHAVVLGGAIMGRLEIEKSGSQVKVGDRLLPPMNLHSYDVTAHPIGVAVLTKTGQQLNSVLIPKGQRIPSDVTERFQLSVPGQTEALITVLQGEEGLPAEKCHKLGEFALKDLPATFDKPHVIDIRGTIDKSGIFTAIAYCTISSKREQLQLSYKNNGTAA